MRGYTVLIPPKKTTEISFEAFCDLYIKALDDDQRRLDDLPDRYPPGTGVIIPLDGADDHEYFNQLLERQGVAKT